MVSGVIEAGDAVGQVNEPLVVQCEHCMQESKSYCYLCNK
jgi:hypothetical protein